MQILIVGAGRIGWSLADSLVNEDNDITVIDTNAQRISEMQERLDLRGVVGDATSPTVLAEAGARDTDIVISVTSRDETNLVVCFLAERLFNIPTRVARVRNSELRAYPGLLGSSGLQTTSTIWPEEAVVRRISRLIEFPEALQLVDFADGRAALFSVRAVAGSPLVGRPVRQLGVHLPTSHARIVSVVRRNRVLDVTPGLVVESGDEVIALSADHDVRRVIREFSRGETPVKNIVIGGDLGLALQLASVLNGADSRRSYNIKILDHKKHAGSLPAKSESEGAIIIDCRLTDEESLSQAGADSCDLFITLSPDDSDNIMGALLAKKLGARKTLAVISNMTYVKLMQGTDIDVIIPSAQATLSEILRHVRRGDVVSAQSLRRGVSEAIEIIAHGDRKSSKVVGRRIRDLRLPEGIRFAALVREQENESRLIMAEPDVSIESDDHVIVFVSNKRLVPKVEKLFSVDAGFF